MSVEEFIEENRIRLKDLAQYIIKSYRINITSQHSGPLHAAIRFFLESMNRRDLGLGMGIDRLERQEKLEEYKANKPPYKWQEA